MKLFDNAGCVWLVILGLVIVCVGCPSVDQIIDEASEIADDIQTPKPTPTPIMDNTDEGNMGTPPGDVDGYHMPTFYQAQANSTLPVGVCLATQNYVPGLKDKGCSISIIHFRITNHWDKAKSVTKTQDQLILSGPNGTNSWNQGAYYKDGELRYKPYAYTTRHKINPDTGYQCPLADGTQRGMALMGFDRAGVYDLYVKAHLTKNRGTAYLGITVNEGDSRTTYWWKWDQNVEQSENVEIQFGEKIRFKGKG